jgi:hypothetical protein
LQNLTKSDPPTINSGDKTIDLSTGISLKAKEDLEGNFQGRQRKPRELQCERLASFGQRNSVESGIEGRNKEFRE